MYRYCFILPFQLQKENKTMGVICFNKDVQMYGCKSNGNFEISLELMELLSWLNKGDSFQSEKQDNRLVGLLS